MVGLVRILTFAFFILSTMDISFAKAGGYKLRPGDVLDVNVWQEPKLNRQVSIAPDGQITFPLAGHLRAGGLTVEAVEAALTEKLKPQYKGELDVSVSLLTVKETPQRQQLAQEKPPDPTFYVTGEVAKPGQYGFNRPTTLLQAIAVAGGLGPFAAGHRVKVRRKINGHEELFEFDYFAFISGADLSRNIRLHQGDVVIVPEKRLFE